MYLHWVSVGILAFGLMILLEKIYIAVRLSKRKGYLQRKETAGRRLKIKIGQRVQIIYDKCGAKFGRIISGR